MWHDNRSRSWLGLALMAAQSFFYNAVFFTFALVMKNFFHIGDRKLPLYLLPFALGSFFGPLVLGPLFDRIGRKTMITATYGLSGLLLAALCIPFATGVIGPVGLDLGFAAVFFVASSAAS